MWEMEIIFLQNYMTGNKISTGVTMAHMTTKQEPSTNMIFDKNATE
jgi:hypothetical protein